jgi:plasmid stabilization system protein ParE
MPGEVVMVTDAVSDVRRLRDFIPTKNPDAAQRAAVRIKDAVQILVENPAAGKPVDEASPFRDLYIAFGNGNYILRYREEETRVVIVRVRHSKEEGVLICI